MVVKRFVGNPEGYLAKLSLEGNIATIYYCSLGEGILKCYDQPNGKLLQNYKLTSLKHHVSLLPNDSSDVPNRILLSLRDPKKNTSAVPFNSIFSWFSFSLKSNNIQYIFCASSSAIQTIWATSLLNWNRHCWEDTVVLYSGKNVDEDVNILRRLLCDSGREIKELGE